MKWVFTTQSKKHPFKNITGFILFSLAGIFTSLKKKDKHCVLLNHIIKSDPTANAIVSLELSNQSSTLCHY